MGELRLRLDVDANRDGVIGDDEPGSADWAWGPEAGGAIAKVDCDRDPSLIDAAELRVVVDGEVPPGASILLSLDASSVGCVTLWSAGDGRPIAGRMPNEGASVAQASVNCQSCTIKVQPHAFPSASFDGLINIEAAITVQTEDGQTVPAASPSGEAIADRALFRVAPWIMPSTLQPPLNVYVVNITGKGDNNARFLHGLTKACADANVPLQEIKTKVARGDRWIQDEIEIGYTADPNRWQSIILDGPRDRELNGVAARELANDDIGVYDIHPQLSWLNTSLDSFGNLEVSPPVTVANVDYRLGRIVHGTKKPLDDQGRKSDLGLRQFLYNQKVQAPFEIFTDWLAVGHVDEIVSFVPDDNSERGFRVLIASPSEFIRIVQKLYDAGYGDASFWAGLRRRDERNRPGGPRADKTVAQILSGKTNGDEPYDLGYNVSCDDILASIRETLKANLGLDDSDFHPVPVGFKKNLGGALAFFPDMVNHLVLGDVSVVPDPYGPEIDGQDPLKTALLDAVGDRRDRVHFVDDWLSYHEMAGEVHCGTNVRRQPAENTKWWELQLPGLWNAYLQPLVS